MPPMRVPKEFARAVEEFQESLRREVGVTVPKSEILRGFAPKLEQIMRRKKEVVKKPNNRRKGWRFDFL